MTMTMTRTTRLATVATLALAVMVAVGAADARAAEPAPAPPDDAAPKAPEATPAELPKTVAPGPETAPDPDDFDPRLFSADSAWTLPEGRWEIGLFKPLRWGVTEDVELSTHPLVNVVMPNLMARIRLTEMDGWRFTSEHTLSWPTQLLRTMQGRGYLSDLPLLNGLLPPDARVPFMLASNHYIHAGRRLAPGHYFSARMGFLLAIGFGDAYLPTVDYPILYTRMAAYHDGFAFTAGVDFRGRIWGPLYYRLELDVWGLARVSGNWSIEHVGMLQLRTSDQFDIELGYKVVVGEYPFGHDAHIFPVLDLVWAWD